MRGMIRPEIKSRNSELQNVFWEKRRYPYRREVALYQKPKIVSREISRFK